MAPSSAQPRTQGVRGGVCRAGVQETCPWRENSPVKEQLLIQGCRVPAQRPLSSGFVSQGLGDSEEGSSREWEPDSGGCRQIQERRLESGCCFQSLGHMNSCGCRCSAYLLCGAVSSTGGWGEPQILVGKRGGGIEYSPSQLWSPLPSCREIQK